MPHPPRYRFITSLGVGSQGKVSLCYSESKRSFVAVKAIKGKDARSLSLARQEFILLRVLDHPGTVSIDDYVFHEGHGYLVYEFLDGLPLSSLSAYLPLELQFIILDDVYATLRSLHQNQLIHADIKPSNIFITNLHYSLEHETYLFSTRLIDFGLSTFMATKALAPRGTLQYLAPENLQGAPLSEYSDLYALGRCFLTALNLPEKSSHAERPAINIQELAPSISTVLSRLLHSVPTHRNCDSLFYQQHSLFLPQSPKRFLPRSPLPQYVLEQLHPIIDDLVSSQSTHIRIHMNLFDRIPVSIVTRYIDATLRTAGRLVISYDLASQRRAYNFVPYAHYRLHAHQFSNGPQRNRTLEEYQTDYTQNRLESLFALSGAVLREERQTVFLVTLPHENVGSSIDADDFGLLRQSLLMAPVRSRGQTIIVELTQAKQLSMVARSQSSDKPTVYVLPELTQSTARHHLDRWFRSHNLAPQAIQSLYRMSVSLFSLFQAHIESLLENGSLTIARGSWYLSEALTDAPTSTPAEKYLSLVLNTLGQLDKRILSLLQAFRGSLTARLLTQLLGDIPSRISDSLRHLRDYGLVSLDVSGNRMYCNLQLQQLPASLNAIHSLTPKEVRRFSRSIAGADLDVPHKLYLLSLLQTLSPLALTQPEIPLLAIARNVSYRPDYAVVCLKLLSDRFRAGNRALPSNVFAILNLAIRDLFSSGTSTVLAKVYFSFFPHVSRLPLTTYYSAVVRTYRLLMAYHGYGSALRFLQNILKHLPSGARVLRALTYAELGNVHHLTYNHDLSFFYYSLAYHTVDIADLPAAYRMGLSAKFHEHPFYLTSIRRFRERVPSIITRLENAPDLDFLINYLLQMQMIAFRLGLFTLCSQFSRALIHATSQCGDLRTLVTALNNYGGVYFERHAFAQCKKILLYDYLINVRLDISAPHALLALQNLAYIDIETGRYRHAEELLLHHILPHQVKIANISKVYFSLLLVGRVYARAGIYAKGMRYLIMFYKYCERTGDPLDLGVCITTLAQAFVNYGAPAKALKFLRFAERLYAENHVLDDYLRAAAATSDVVLTYSGSAQTTLRALARLSRLRVKSEAMDVSSIYYQHCAAFLEQSASTVSSDRAIAVLAYKRALAFDVASENRAQAWKNCLRLSEALTRTGSFGEAATYRKAGLRIVAEIMENLPQGCSPGMFLQVPANRRTLSSSAIGP
jgi:serine/threonine protein kinase